MFDFMDTKNVMYGFWIGLGFIIAYIVFNMITTVFGLGILTNIGIAANKDDE